MLLTTLMYRTQPLWVIIACAAGVCGWWIRKLYPFVRARFLRALVMRTFDRVNRQIELNLIAWSKKDLLSAGLFLYKARDLLRLAEMLGRMCDGHTSLAALDEQDLLDELKRRDDRITKRGEHEA